MTDLDRCILDAWDKIRPHLEQNPDELIRRLARRRQTMLRRPMRHCCLALRACDHRINAYHWPITPDHAEDLNHPGHPYEPIEHEVLIQTPQLRKFYQPFRLDRWGEEVPYIAKQIGCSPSSLDRARRRGYYTERSVPHLGGKRGKPIPILHHDRPLFPGGQWFFQPPPPILGPTWTWLAELLPDNFEQAVIRTPHFTRKHNPRATLFPNPKFDNTRDPRDLSPAAASQPPYITPDYRFTGYRWLCPGCKKPVRKIYYPLPMRLLSGFLTPDPAKEFGLTAADIPGGADILVRESNDFPQFFACAKCHQIQWFDSVHPCGWNNLISHMTAGLLFGHEVTPPPWYHHGQRTRARIRQLHRPSPRRDMVLRRLLNGHSNKKIQLDLQITKGALDSHLQSLFKQHDVPDRHALVEKLGGATSPPLNQHERAAQRRFQVQQLLLEGLPIKEMIAQLNTDYSTVMRDIHAIYRHHDIPPSKGTNNARRALAKKLGIELPPIGAKLMTLQVQELHVQGLSIPQIAQQLNRCEAVIRRHLKKLKSSPVTSSSCGSGMAITKSPD